MQKDARYWFKQITTATWSSLAKVIVIGGVVYFGYKYNNETLVLFEQHINKYDPRIEYDISHLDSQSIHHELTKFCIENNFTSASVRALVPEELAVPTHAALVTSSDQNGDPSKDLPKLLPLSQMGEAFVQIHNNGVFRKPPDIPLNDMWISRFTEAYSLRQYVMVGIYDSSNKLKAILTVLDSERIYNDEEINIIKKKGLQLRLFFEK